MVIFFKSEGTNKYYVYIGFDNGKKSELYYYTPSNLLEFSHDMSHVHCDSFMDFWVMWNDTTIEVGQGTTAITNVFLRYSPITVVPTIDDMEIESDIPADWIFKLEQVGLESRIQIHKLTRTLV